MQDRGVALRGNGGPINAPDPAESGDAPADAPPLRCGDLVRQPLAVLILAAASLWAAAQANAQSRPLPLVAFLSGASVTADTRLPAFHNEMRERGYVENTSFRFEARGADGKFDRLPSLARELIAMKPDVLFVMTTPASLAAKKATAKIPIVFVGVVDPLGVGLVSSLAHPGANITGITNINAELTGKRLELLMEIVPNASNVAVIVNPSVANARIEMRNAENAARRLGVRLSPVLTVSKAADLDPAFRTVVQEKAHAVLRMVDPTVNLLRAQTARLAAKYRVPVMFAFREDVIAGGLVAYGANIALQYRQAAGLIDKILKGARPADLPIEQPTKFELVVNLKTAKALGIIIPHSILARADEVIE